MNTTELGRAIANDPDNPLLYLERGKENFKVHNLGAALNDFKKVCDLDPDCQEAQEYIVMIEEILEYHYLDILNP